MAHNIDMTNGRANMAFVGERSAIWHGLGQQMPADASQVEWLKAAGLDWRAEKVEAFARLPDGTMVPVDGCRHVARSDNWSILGTATDRYQPHQPTELAEQFERYISVDPRFRRDTMMSLAGGRVIAMTAVFNGDIQVGGGVHKAHLLSTTSYDSTSATINRAMMTRVVCRNTLNAALGESGGVVRTRHNTRYNADRIARELETIVASIEAYKTMGDAMAAVGMAKETVSKYFKRLLDIPFDAKGEDISTRKMNQFQDLGAAYRSTVAEGTEPETAWCALNAVTRYVDHDRSTRGGDGGKLESRFMSAQFGSGAAMKSEAVRLLTVDDEFAALLKAPMRRGEMDDAALLRAVTGKVALPSLS